METLISNSYIIHLYADNRHDTRLERQKAFPFIVYKGRLMAVVSR